MREVDDHGMHKGFTADAIGGPSGSNARMMRRLELIDGSESVGGELAKGVTFGDQPWADPTVTRGRWDFLFASRHNGSRDPA